VGKTPVVAVKDRKTKKITAKVVDGVNKATVVPIVESSRKPGAKLGVRPRYRTGDP